MTPIANKFVQWEVPALETLRNSRAYKLRESLNNGGKLSREDKNWITPQREGKRLFQARNCLKWLSLRFLGCP